MPWFDLATMTFGPVVAFLYEVLKVHGTMNVDHQGHSRATSKIRNPASRRLCRHRLRTIRSKEAFATVCGVKSAGEVKLFPVKKIHNDVDD